MPLWKPVPGYEGLYDVSDRGDVRAVRTGGNLKPRVIRPYGYKSVVLSRQGSRKTVYVHQLVMLAFVGPRPVSKEVAHANGDAGDCRLANLRYATRAENVADKIAHGRQPRGERAGGARLNERLVREIRDGAETAYSLAKRLGLSVAAILKARKRKTWAHVA